MSRDIEEILDLKEKVRAGKARININIIYLHCEVELSQAPSTLANLLDFDVTTCKRQHINCVCAM